MDLSDYLMPAFLLSTLICQIVLLRVFYGERIARIRERATRRVLIWMSWLAGPFKQSRARLTK